MFLKTLHIAGFKSFAQPVRLELGPGITGIIGPNGSGKSNIVDAVRWVLGEQSARALRGTRSDDVIFSGSALRHAQGMAEVSLVLDNSDGRVALDLADVAIARRLYRSGETEYLLNRRRARLRDVLDIAGQAGLGPDSYCVVGQGVVEQLVLQRPQERRGLIADAADIRRYEARLTEIESDLTETQHNALRISAVVAELRPQVERLRQQAERAERHRKVRDEVERLARAWFGRALPAARRAVEAAEQCRVDIQAAVAEIRARLGDADRVRTRAQAALQEARTHRADAEHRRARSHAVREALHVKAAESASQVQHLGARREQLVRERGALAARLRAAHAAARATQAAFEREQALGRATERPEESAAARQAEDRRAAARRRREEAEAAVADARRQVEALERQGVRLHAERAAAAAGLAALAARRAELEARVGELDAALRARAEEIAAARAELPGLEREATRARAHHSARQSTRRAAEDVRNNARRALDRLAGEEQVLASLIASVGPGQEADRLMRFLSVALPDQAAIAAALGAAARYAVVDATGTAWYAEPVASNATVLVPARAVLPADGPRLRGRMADALGDAVQFAFAVEVLGATPYADLAERYLGTTVIVADLTSARIAAERLIQACPSIAFQVATRDGQCLRWNGERVLAPEPTVARDLELAGRRNDLQARLGVARAELDRAEVELSAAQAAEATALTALRSVDDRRRAGAAGVGRLQEQIRALEEARKREEQELARLTTAAPHPPAASVFTEHEQLLAAARAALDDAQARLRASLDDVEAAEDALRHAIERDSIEATARAVRTERLARLQQAATHDQQEVQALERRDAALAAELHAVEEQLRNLEPQRRSLLRDVEQADRAVGAAERELATVEAEVRALEAESLAAHEALERLQAQLGDQRAAEANALAELERARARRERLEIEATAVAEQLATTPEHLLGPGMPEPGELSRVDDETLQRRLARAARELRGVGAVDYGVLAEFRRVEDRCSYLTVQLDDLARTEARIREGMQEVRQRVQERFGTAFQEVNAQFKELFRELFRGGDAELVLTGDPEHPQTGVDIVAQPPGKRLNRLATLSGGERALLGAALLLALISTNPSPFCMLDEVDAALDEANVQRFVATIRDLARQTQFILVTHNRATMEMADALYGVTMNPGAVSQVLAVRLPDAMEG